MLRFSKSNIFNNVNFYSITLLVMIILNIENKIGRPLLENEKQSIRDMLVNVISIDRNYRYGPEIEKMNNILHNPTINSKYFSEIISNKWIYSYYI
jgi:hypothetical protein